MWSAFWGVGPPYGQQVGATHPTGMRAFLSVNLLGVADFRDVLNFQHELLNTNSRCANDNPIGKETKHIFVLIVVGK